MRKTIIVLFLTLVFIAAETSSRAYPPCIPSARWAVKTLSDTDARKINFHPRKMTVSEMVRLKTYIYPYPLESGRHGVEFNTYEVVCRIKLYSIAPDGDLNLVVVDPKRPKDTMIAEVPNPDCPDVRHAQHAKTFRTVWEQFRTNCTFGGKIIFDGRKHRVIRGLYRLTGVGFVDIPHLQSGRARNEIEMHPVLSIERAGTQ